MKLLTNLQCSILCRQCVIMCPLSVAHSQQHVPTWTQGGNKCPTCGFDFHKTHCRSKFPVFFLCSYCWEFDTHLLDFIHSVHRKMSPQSDYKATTPRVVWLENNKKTLNYLCRSFPWSATTSLLRFWIYRKLCKHMVNKRYNSRAVFCIYYRLCSQPCSSVSQ